MHRDAVLARGGNNRFIKVMDKITLSTLPIG